MGMDVYGLNPKIKEGSIKPKRIDFGKATEEERDKYWKAENKYQKRKCRCLF